MINVCAILRSGSILSSDDNPISLVFGPTASGKTSFAVTLAKQSGGEIINADSMQIYSGLPLLTALPTISERADIAHHLFGTVDPSERWSVGKWLEVALKLISEITARGNHPILVGGTGLYFEALTKGLAKIPQISTKTALAITKVIEEIGLIAGHDKLKLVDPIAADKIHSSDRQRLIRALSVFEETGKTLTSFQQTTTAILAANEWQGTVLLPEREVLYERINRRFDTMMQNGALDEVKAFKSKSEDQSISLHKAIGFIPLSRYLDGDISLIEACDLAKRDSRRYAKRQMTWARGRVNDWHFVDPLQFGTDK